MKTLTCFWTVLGISAAIQLAGCNREDDSVNTSQSGGGPSQQPAETVPIQGSDPDATPLPADEKSP